MLENLETVPWDNLSHAYGLASDTPVHLRNLASADRQTRDDAFNKLSDSIVHQGSVYEAAIYAIPFLVELLKADTVQGKENVLDLLTEIAFGGSWHERHKRFTNLLDPTTEEYLQKTKEEEEWVSRIQTSLRKYINVFIGFLEDENESVFYSVVTLLTHFNDLDEDMIQTIVNLALDEQRESRQADLLFLLGIWHRDRFQPFYLEFFETTNSELVKLVAAINIGYSSHEIPESVTDFLSSIILRNDRDLIKKYYSLGAAYDYWLAIAQILVLAGPVYTHKCASMFIEEVEKSVHCWEEQLLSALLVVFYQDGKTQTDHPNDVQKKAVYAVAKNAFPDPLATHCNAIDVLETFGLPSTREDMDNYLGLPNENDIGFDKSEKEALAEYQRQRGIQGESKI